MKNYKTVLFFVFIFLYVAGLLFGSFSQVGTENQKGMYEYLEKAVSGYDVSISDSIKQILEDNVKTLVLLVAGGILLLGPFIMAIMLVVKGYTAGFAITAMLRLFGAKGLVFCGANFLSTAILIPAIAWFSVSSCDNILANRYDKSLFLKNFFKYIVIMLPILLLDGIIRGVLSSILLRFAS